jgi:hypothetical protein
MLVPASKGLQAADAAMSISRLALRVRRGPDGPRLAEREDSLRIAQRDYFWVVPLSGVLPFVPDKTLRLPSNPRRVSRVHMGKRSKKRSQLCHGPTTAAMWGSYEWMVVMTVPDVFSPFL